MTIPKNLTHAEVGALLMAVPDANTFAEMDKATNEWEMRAARGECAWVCADCCSTFLDGMPDACDHGIQRCTDIIQRDKKKAKEKTK